MSPQEAARNDEPPDPDMQPGDGLRIGALVLLSMLLVALAAIGVVATIDWLGSR